jgi:hypothetical protein
MAAISRTESGKESATLLRLLLVFVATVAGIDADNSGVQPVITDASVVGLRST